MDLFAVLDQVIDLLRSRGRVSYRALRVQLHLDDEAIEALKDELIHAQHVAVDEDGKVLVWTGGDGGTPAPAPSPSGPSGRQADLPADVTSQPTEVRTPDAERRQLTVLFCDLVDSTALASQLDPEEWRDVVRAYQATCAKVIQRFEGHIAQYLGDGLLVYFGYPQAHEDDAQRAIRTGLGIIEAMGELNARLDQDTLLRLAVRIGIHTGLVVVGEVGGGPRQEQLALGETPNVAARLQGIAAPDTVVVSAATLRLVQGFFSAEDRGTHRLKGLATPVHVYRVLSESGALSRLDAAVTHGLTPLVGRELEVTLLLERWAQVKEGIGQVVVLSGEPGIGKSRLVEVLKDRVAAEPHTRLECRCSPYHQHSALYPVIELLPRALGWAKEDTPDAKEQKLEAALSRAHLDPQNTVPLLASLLSLPLPECYAPPALTPQRQRQRTLEALLAMVLELAAQQPVLFIVEDLHWIDPSTLEFLTLLVDQGPTARLFTLCTCRPEFRPPWSTRAHLTPITLNRLPRRLVGIMVARVAGDKALPSTVVQQVVARTDGVPLFVEELTKMVLESGLLREREGCYELTGPLPPLAIPTTLHDSLMARLDRLAPVKEVAQLGATLGRTFPYELLQAISPLDEATLQHALAQLVEAELLYQRGMPPQATYLFKHALLQEAAYQSVLKSTRQHSHRRIAQVLAERFPETTQTQPELLAYHYTEAGLMAQAIPYWQRAGQCAIERSALPEAIAHLTKGLELLKRLPDTPDRTQQELMLQITVGVPLIATHGYGSREVKHAYTRAWELCQRIEESPQLFVVLRGLWNWYLLKAELQTAYAQGEQILSLAHRQQDPALLVEACRVMGTTLFFQGALVTARASLAQGIGLYDRQQHRALAFQYGADPGVVCRLYDAWALWLRGYPDQALSRIHDALDIARALSHPFSLAFALNIATFIRHFRRESQAAHELAEENITLSTEQRIAQWLAQGTVERGWALTEQGETEAGIAHMHQGLAAWRGTGADLVVPYYLSLLAGVYGNVGQTEEGLAFVDEALTTVNNNGERWWEAELYRLKGELLLIQAAKGGGLENIPHETSIVAAADGGATGRSPRRTEAEACFRQALDVARRQEARSLELRAAMSLGRLWQQQGKRDEAHQLLAPIYSWFTEGFDTADLQEAKALLKELLH
jgi:class 3 adenylate cyclase/predicted ATPase